MCRHERKEPLCVRLPCIPRSHEPGKGTGKREREATGKREREACGREASEKERERALRNLRAAREKERERERESPP
jgi:hypothetical protein